MEKRNNNVYVIIFNLLKVIAPHTYKVMKLRMDVDKAKCTESNRRE